MEDLLLGALLAGNELDIVYQQDFGPPVALTEFLGAPFSDGIYQLIGEPLRGSIDDP